MNDLTIWNYEGSNVRTLVIDDETWFVGRDICNAFGDTNSHRSLNRIDNDDKKIIEITDVLGRKQKAIFVNESGMYALLFTMQPQKANNNGMSNAYPIEVQERIEKLHRFKRWVTHKVLPEIRRTGSYSIPTPALTVKDYINNTCKELGMNQPIFTGIGVCAADFPRDFYILQAWEALLLIYRFAPDSKAIIIDEKNISDDTLYIRFRVHLFAKDNYFETKFNKKDGEWTLSELTHHCPFKKGKKVTYYA